MELFDGFSHQKALFMYTLPLLQADLSIELDIHPRKMKTYVPMDWWKVDEMSPVTQPLHS